MKFLNTLMLLGSLLKIYIPVYYNPSCAIDKLLCKLLLFIVLPVYVTIYSNSETIVSLLMLSVLCLNHPIVRKDLVYGAFFLHR